MTEKNDSGNNATASNESSELAKLRVKAEEYLNGWKRALADYDNHKKESAAHLAQRGASERARIIEKIILIYDTFEQALEHIPMEHEQSPWRTGLLQIQKLVKQLIDEEGASLIETAGVPFDPVLHEAIETRSDTSKPDNEVLTVAARGYRFNGETIRPAKVVVNSLHKEPTESPPPNSNP